MYLTHHPRTFLVASGARVAGVQVTVSGPKHLCVYPKMPDKSCHFLYLWSWERGWDGMAEPSLHIQSLWQADLLNWVHTQSSTEENGTQAYSGVWRRSRQDEGGRGRFTCEEPGSMGRREEGRVENSERALTTLALYSLVIKKQNYGNIYIITQDKEPFEYICIIGLRITQEKSQKEPATSPQVRQLVIFIQNQSHVWAC